MEPDAQTLQALLQQLARLGVELGIHEPTHEVDDVDFEAAVHQAASGFQTEQTAADDGGFFGVIGVIDDLGAIVESAKHESA